MLSRYNCFVAILITGVTGFLGRHFLMELLLSGEREPGSIIALARKPRRGSLEKLMEQQMNLTALHCQKPEAEITKLISRMKRACRWLEGDVCKKFLGIKQQIWDEIKIEHIWHMAALLRFEEYKRKNIFMTNALGTKNALELARYKQIQCFHLTSTLYVAGEKPGTIAEEPCDPGYGTNNPFEESKRTAEDLVLANAPRNGFTWRIYRPGIIMPHSRAVQNESRLALENYLKKFLQFRDHVLERMPGYFDENALTIFTNKNATVNCIDVDVLCKSMLKIAQNPQSKNMIFQITSDNAVCLSEINQLIGQMMEVQVKHTTNFPQLNEVDRLFASHMEIFSSYKTSPKKFLTLKAAKYGISGEKNTYTKTRLNQILLLFAEQYIKRRDRFNRLSSSLLKTLTKKTILSPEEELSYYITGKGEPLVLLNSYGQSFTLWNPLLLKLKKHYQVIIWQPRGSASLMGGINRYFPMEKHVDDLSKILNVEKIKKCSILAWHTGPKLAIELYRKNPLMISDMIFLSPSFKGTSLQQDKIPFGPDISKEKVEAAYEKNTEIIFKIIVAEPRTATRVITSLKTLLVGKNIQLKKFLPEDNLAQVLSMINRSLKPVIIEPFLSPDRVVEYARQLLEFWSYDISGQIEKVDIPVLLVCGEYDKIISKQMAYHTGSMIKNAKALELKGCTHFPQYENSELLYDIINKFHKEKESFAFHDTRVVEISP